MVSLRLLAAVSKTPGGYIRVPVASYNYDNVHLSLGSFMVFEQRDGLGRTSNSMTWLR